MTNHVHLLSESVEDSENMALLYEAYNVNTKSPIAPSLIAQNASIL